MRIAREVLLFILCENPQTSDEISIYEAFGVCRIFFHHGTVPTLYRLV
jgi:hypothetical protein